MKVTVLARVAVSTKRELSYSIYTVEYLNWHDHMSKMISGSKFDWASATRESNNLEIPSIVDSTALLNMKPSWGIKLTTRLI